MSSIEIFKKSKDQFLARLTGIEPVTPRLGI